MAIQVNYHVVPLILPENIVLLGQLIGHANYGMLDLGNASKLSEVIMMRFWMRLSIALEISLPLLVQMVLQESTMFLLEHVQLSFRVTKTKYQKFNSTLKETKLSLPLATRLVAFGTQTLEWSNKCWTVMKMKFSHAHSTTKETQSSLVQKITPVVSGETQH